MNGCVSVLSDSIVRKKGIVAGLGACLALYALSGFGDLRYASLFMSQSGFYFLVVPVLCGQSFLCGLEKFSSILLTG